MDVKVLKVMRICSKILVSSSSVLAATGSPPCSATLKRLSSVPAVHLFSASLQEARQG